MPPDLKQSIVTIARGVGDKYPDGKVPDDVMQKAAAAFVLKNTAQLNRLLGIGDAE